MAKLFFYNGRVITPWRVLENGHVLVEDGIITAVSGGHAEIPQGAIGIDAGGNYIAPGFIDIHTHGGGGFDFMDGDVESITGAAKAHLVFGTTTIVPTTVSADNAKLWPVFESYRKAKTQNHGGAELGGLHLEGPYFNIEQKGAMDPKFVRNPDMREVEEVLSQSDDIVRWSVAPELPGALAMGSMLRQKGIIASLGHTMAVHDQVVEAFENGFTLCTHLYSAMAGVRRINAFRHAGPVESAFLLDDMDVEIIADGVHLPPALLKLIVQNKGPARIALITDSMRAAGQEGGTSILGAKDTGLPVIIEDGVAKLSDRSAFAGSIATTDRLIRVMRKQAGVAVEDAVRMMTATPARIMGYNDRGRLAPSYRGDIVIFDEDIRMQAVYVGGELRHQA